DFIIRPCRMGTNSRRRPLSDSLMSESGLMRPFWGFHSARELRGHLFRNASPFAKSSVRERRDGNASTFSGWTCRTASPDDLFMLLVLLMLLVHGRSRVGTVHLAEIAVGRTRNLTTGM